MNNQKLRFEAFKTQDQELGYFDVVFVIDGKKLYAHKFMLGPISTTFASMISNRWTSKDEQIPIETYSYDDFYQFLSFLYSEKCELTMDNIATMVDMAEFYQVSDFKDYCNEYLKDLNWTAKNAFQYLEISIKYSMVQLTKSLIRSVRLNLFESEEFLEIPKELLLSILEADQSEIPNDEEMFHAAYKWAKKQAKAKKELDASLKINETIKEILADFMSYFNFTEMDYNFVTKKFVEKALLPPGPKVNAILSNLNKKASKVIVIIDENMKIMKGRFFDTDDVCADISMIDESCICDDDDDEAYFWWSDRLLLPKKQKPKGNFDEKWCLTYANYNFGHAIMVKKGLNRDDVYFISEMIAEEKFVLNEECRIYVIQY